MTRFKFWIGKILGIKSDGKIVLISVSIKSFRGEQIRSYHYCTDTFITIATYNI